MTAVAEHERVQMESKNYCAYNRTQGCFLSLRISTADAQHQSAHEQLQSLAENSQSGLWMSPFASLPEGHSRLVFDLVYLDQDCRVLAIESFPNASARQPDQPIASALALPPRTITATITQPGDELIIWSLSESEPQPQRGVRSSRASRSRSAAASRAEQHGSPSVTPPTRQPDHHAPAETTSDAEADTPQQPSFFKRLFGGRLVGKDDAPVSIFASDNASTASSRAPQASSSIPGNPAPSRVQAPSPTPPFVEASQPSKLVDSIPTPAPERVQAADPHPLSAAEVVPVQSVAPEPPALAVASLPSDEGVSTAPLAPLPQPDLLATAAIEPPAVETPEPPAVVPVPPLSASDAVPSVSQEPINPVIAESSTATEAPIAQQAPVNEPSPLPAAIIASSIAEAHLAPPAPVASTASSEPTEDASQPIAAAALSVESEPPIAPQIPTESVVSAPAHKRRLVAIPGPNGTAFVVQRADEPQEPIPSPAHAVQPSDSSSEPPARHQAVPVEQLPLAPAAATGPPAPLTPPVTSAPPVDAELESSTSPEHAARKAKEWKKARKHAQRREAERRDAKRKFQFQNKSDADTPPAPSLGKRFVHWLTAPPTAAKRMRTPEIVAYFWTGGTPRPHSVANISVTGLYILTKDRWLPGTVLVMNLQWTDTDGNHPGDAISVLAKVIRSGDDGVGFQFVTSNDIDLLDGQHIPGKGSDRAALDRFLWRRKRPAAKTSA